LHLLAGRLKDNFDAVGSFDGFWARQAEEGDRQHSWLAVGLPEVIQASIDSCMLLLFILLTQAKERKDGPIAGKGDAKTREKTSKNEVSFNYPREHAFWMCIYVYSGPYTFLMPVSCVQEKKERRALKALEGNEDDIDALLAK
jgi:hypothetical protein